MDNIIEVYELEGTHVSKIYRFIGDSESDDTSKSETPTKNVNQYIHNDDSISTIKYKIFSALDSKVSVEEMYLFCHQNVVLHPRQVFTLLSQEDELSLSGKLVCSFMKNIHKRITCDPENDFEYDFILDNIDSNASVVVDTSIGTKCLLKKKYPFIVNPFKCNIVDDKISQDDYNIVQTTNSNLLFQYNNIKRIYLCKAPTVLRMNTNVSQEYLIKLYFPLLFKKKIVSSELLDERNTSLIEKNIESLNSTKFDLYNDKVNLFYDMFHDKKSDLEYLSSGITNIKFTIHPRNSEIFPIDILFKLIHSTNEIPFIKYNPGNKRENIYRLFTGNNIATNGKKIPILYTEYGNRKNKIKQLSKELARKKRVAFFISVPIEDKKQDIICEFSDKGDIFISIDFSKPVDIMRIEDLIRDSINEAILEKIYDFLSQSGYNFVLFQNLSDPNIEINNITYVSSIAHNKKINLNKFASCISSIFTINKGIIKSNEDTILLTYKRVSNYKKMDAIQTFISDSLREGNTTADVIQNISIQFDKEPQEAARLVASWISESDVLVDAFENKKIFKNSPGFPVFITSDKILDNSVYKQASIIKVENINNLNYLHFLHIYIDSMMRLVIDKKSTNVTVKKINSLCNKKTTDNDIELPQVMADDEKSLSTKIDESVAQNLPQAYQDGDDDDESDIDDLFGMIDDDDDDDEDGEFEEGEFEMGNLIMGNNLAINNSIDKSPSKSQPPSKKVDEEPSPELKVSENEVKNNQPPSSDTTSEMDIDWSGLSVSGAKNIFMKRLIEYDKELFLKKPQGKFGAYTRTCPWQYRKQPVVLNDKDKEYIDRMDQKTGIKSYDEHLTYGSGTKKNHYICPRFWCLQDEQGRQRSITANEINEGGCGGWDAIIPATAKKIPKGKRIFQFTDERFHREKKKDSEKNKLIYKPMYPGYMDPSKHPKGLCIPCCFESPRAAVDSEGNIWEKIRGQDWREGSSKKKSKWIFYWRNKKTGEKSLDPPEVELEGLMYKANPTPTYEEKDGKIIIDSIRGEKQKRPLVSKGKREKTWALCDDQKIESGKKQDKKVFLDEAPITSFPLKSNQLGYLSISLQKFLEFNNNTCKVSKTSDPRLKPETECLLRKGIKINKSKSFLEAICDIYWFVLDDKKEETIKLKQDKVLKLKQLIDIIKSRITLDNFVALQNGTLVELFAKDKTINPSKYSETRLFTLSNTSDLNMKYFHKVASSYENFIDYISDPKSNISYEYLWDFITMPSNITSDGCCGLFPDGLNLIILREPEDDVVSKMELICPTNHYSDVLFDDSKPTLMLYNKYSYFEPIYRITKKSNSKYTLKKLFFFDNLQRDAPGLVEILTMIKTRIIKNCKPMPSLPKIYKYRQNKNLKDVLSILRNNQYTPENLVANFNSRIIGVTVTSRKNDFSMFVPCYPSAMLLDSSLPIVFSHEITGVDCKNTLDYLNEMKNINLLTKPIQLIVNDEMIVGTVTETNQFVPIEPEAYISSPCNMEGNKHKLAIIKTYSNNYYELDANMLMDDTIDTTRIETVKKIKLESNFFNMFRNYLRIVLLNFENQQIKREIIDLVQDVTIDYYTKILRLRDILYSLLDPFIEFSIYPTNSIYDIEKIFSCLNLSKGDCNKKKNCIFSDGSCKIHIPRTNLISGSENREIYFGRIADELIRYPRIRNFILKPKAFLSLNPITYELNNNEIILLEQLLLEKYFEDIVIRAKNKYITTKRIFELTNPDKSEKYSSNFKYSKELEATEINPCIITNSNESAFEGKQGSFTGAGKFWRDLGLDSNFTMKEFRTTPSCSWDIIKTIYIDHYKRDISTQQLKDILIAKYNELFENDSDLMNKILNSIKWKNRFYLTKKSLRDISETLDDDYYLSFFDLLILISDLKLPVAIISRLSLPSFNKLPSGKGHSRKTLLINTKNSESIYIIFGSRWKQAPLLPVYSLVEYSRKFLINISVFPELEREIIKNAITFSRYMEEQTWQFKKKKKKQKKLVRIIT